VPPNTCRTLAASAPARASLSSGRNMRSCQPRSGRPLSRPPRPLCRHPACGALLVSFDFYKIAPIGAAAELQDIGEQRGKAAVGVLSSRIVSDLLVCVFPSVPFTFFLVCSLSCADVAHRPPVALFLLFDMSPSRRHNAASSQRLSALALSTSSPLLHIAAMHAEGSLKSRETTVSRHQILSVLFQDHRVPTRRTLRDHSALYPALLPSSSTPPFPRRRTSCHPTFFPAAALPPLPCLQWPARLSPSCRRLRVLAKLGPSTERSGALVPPSARTTSACEPASTARHRCTVRAMGYRGRAAQTRRGTRWRRLYEADTVI
jgi:hypothetical protein